MSIHLHTSVDTSQEDVIDEAILLFRANCFFRNYEIKGTADRALIYLTLFIQECLGKLAAYKPYPPSLADATKLLTNHATSSFALPGEAGFPLNAMYERVNTADRAEVDQLRAYLNQLRQETVVRLLATLYSTSLGASPTPSKWWMCFAKRRFMNLAGVGTV